MHKVFKWYINQNNFNHGKNILYMVATYSAIPEFSKIYLTDYLPIVNKLKCEGYTTVSCKRVSLRQRFL